MTRGPAILYISYDGMLEPLGQSQVISYLERLAEGYAIHLISFEKPADRQHADKVAAVRNRLDRAGIVWHPLTYHKTPTLPATLFDLAQGTVFALWLTWRHRISLIHARSYVPALIGRAVKLLTGARLLFDIRGFWADERTDGGIWPAGGRTYRVAKQVEKSLMLAADHVVTLTHASREVIASFPYFKGNPPPITVIPTCADLERFSPGPAPQRSPFTLGYVGSIGTWYLFDEVIECFRLLRQRRPDARLLIVNRNEQELVRQSVAAAGIPSDCIEIVAADHAEVPHYVRRMHAGAAIIRPVYSKIASAPTKLAEYLGCGVPCLGNTGVGDMELILEREGCGVAMTGFTPEERNRAVDRLLEMADDPATASRCRQAAMAHFSNADGAERYREIYRDLAR